MKVCQSTSLKKVVLRFKKHTQIKVANCKIPVLVPYYKLVQFLEGNQQFVLCGGRIV